MGTVPMNDSARRKIAFLALLSAVGMWKWGVPYGASTGIGTLPFHAGTAVALLVFLLCFFSLRALPLLVLLAMPLVGIAWWMQDRNDTISRLVEIGAIFGVLALYGLSPWLAFLWKNRVGLRALRLSQQGDTEGGIQMLQEHLERGGPSGRIYYYLALLFAVKHDWEESLRMAEEAERLEGMTPEILGAKGMALWKLGRGSEAAPFLRECALQSPNSLFAACNYGRLAAELGEWDEAREMLRRAEAIHVNQIPLGGARNREMRRRELDALRRSVDNRPASD